MDQQRTQDSIAEQFESAPPEQAATHPQATITPTGDVESLSALELLRTIHGQSQGWVVLWAKRNEDKKSWAYEPHELGQLVEQAKILSSQGWNVYYSVNPQGGRPDVERGRRGEAATVASLNSLYIDCDLASKDPAYPTESIAKAAIEKMPHAPTAIICSGSGWHIYWVLDKPFPIESEEDRERAQHALKSWQTLFRERLEGFTLDPVAELARVLRVPETVNQHCKGLVEIVHLDQSRRLGFSQIETQLPKQQPRPKRSGGLKTGLPDASQVERKIFSTYLKYAKRGNRNITGFKMFQQLHWNDVPIERAIAIASEYVAAVSDGGALDYSLSEAIASVRSAYRNAMREAWSWTQEPQRLPAFTEQQFPKATLDEARDINFQNTLGILGKHQLSLNRARTGMGKSHATINAAIQAGSSITTMPTHANLAERAEDFRKLGAESVGVVPRRTEDNCKDLSRVYRNRAIGINPCSGCTLREHCLFKQQEAEALQATHILMTHDAYKVRRPKAAFINHDEDALRALQTVRSITYDDLKSLQNVLILATHRASGREIKADDLLGHRLFQEMLEIAEKWLPLLHHEEKTTDCELDLPEGIETEKWEKPWRQAVESAGIKINSEAFHALRTVANGNAATAALIVSHKRMGSGSNSKVFIEKAIVVVENVPPPANGDVLLTDATGRVEAVGKITGRPVEDITPNVDVPLTHPIIQFPGQDIRKRTEISTVWKLAMGLILQLPPTWMIGLQGFRNHLDELMGDGEYSLPKTIKQRVHVSHYIGEGPDRGSNAWHTESDVVIRLATCRPDMLAVKRQLVALNQLEAIKGDFSFGKAIAQGIGIDGQPVEFEYLRYLAPEPHKAHQDIATANDIQGTGRGRGLLAEGVPVYAFSSSPLPGALVAPDIPPVSRGAWRAVEGCFALGANWGNPLDISRGKTQLTPHPVAKIHEGLGADVECGTVEEWLRQAEELGLVRRPHGERSGWCLTSLALFILLPHLSQSESPAVASNDVQAAGEVLDSLPAVVRQEPSEGFTGRVGEPAVSTVLSEPALVTATLPTDFSPVPPPPVTESVVVELSRAMDREFERLKADYRLQGLNDREASIAATADLPSTEAYHEWSMAHDDLVAYRDRYQDPEDVPWRMRRKHPPIQPPADPITFPEPTQADFAYEDYLRVEERAAIYEFDADLPEAEAVQLAIRDTILSPTWRSPFPTVGLPVDVSLCAAPDRGP